MNKEIATFACKSTSLTKSTDASGTHTFVVNVEGTATGEFAGALVGTMILTTRNLQSGTFTSDYAAYMADSVVVAGQGLGVYSSLGGHRWRMNGYAVVGDGRTVRTEADVDLASRSMNGKVFA